MWHDVAMLVDSRGPLRDWGDAPENSVSVLATLKVVRDHLGLNKMKDLRRACSTYMAPPGCLAHCHTEKATLSKVQHLEKELKLKWDMQLMQTNNKEALGKQLEQTSEQVTELACDLAHS